MRIRASISIFSILSAAFLSVPAIGQIVGTESRSVDIILRDIPELNRQEFISQLSQENRLNTLPQTVFENPDYFVLRTKPEDQDKIERTLKRFQLEKLREETPGLEVVESFQGLLNPLDIEDLHSQEKSRFDEIQNYISNGNFLLGRSSDYKLTESVLDEKKELSGLPYNSPLFLRLTENSYAYFDGNASLDTGEATKLKGRLLSFLSEGGSGRSTKLDTDLKITPIKEPNSEIVRTSINGTIYSDEGVFEVLSIGNSGAHVVIPLENTSEWEDDPFYEDGETLDALDGEKLDDSGFDLNEFDNGLNCHIYSDGVLDIAWIASDNNSKVLNILTSFGNEKLDGVNTPAVLSTEFAIVQEALAKQNLADARINFFPLSEETLAANFSTIDKVVRDKQIPEKLLELQGTKNVDLFLWILEFRDYVIQRENKVGCGFSTRNPENPNSSIILVDPRCFKDNAFKGKRYTIGHEVGHFFGGRHNIGCESVKDYRHAWVDRTTTKGTLTSCAKSTKNRLIGYSDPIREMGSTEEEHIVRAISEVYETVTGHSGCRAAISQ